MTFSDARKSYREASTRLFDIVLMRNKMLRRLDMMARPAMDLKPGDSTVFKFDTARARDLLAAIDELTPRINAGMNEVNQYAEQTGSPRVWWESVTLNLGK